MDRVDSRLSKVAGFAKQRLKVGAAIVAVLLCVIAIGDALLAGYDLTPFFGIVAFYLAAAALIVIGTLFSTWFVRTRPGSIVAKVGESIGRRLDGAFMWLFRAAAVLGLIAILVVLAWMGGHILSNVFSSMPPWAAVIIVMLILLLLK